MRHVKAIYFHCCCVRDKERWLLPNRHVLPIIGLKILVLDFSMCVEDISQLVGIQFKERLFLFVSFIRARLRPYSKNKKYSNELYRERKIYDSRNNNKLLDHFSIADHVDKTKLPAAVKFAVLLDSTYLIVKKTLVSPKKG
ncbi:hypothetical protein CEXT_800301 [Caerostris extrusa]|uniref:Uncharacterized protein n=1 Tax=Caerostris extrusa TaxID=172846 RepID=A0AAV4TFK1_CAEEX|nr:hypothetical protein CEXT_800301 [Caerostris extrusa]